jgi:hypothetical protein
MGFRFKVDWIDHNLQEQTKDLASLTARHDNTKLSPILPQPDHDLETSKTCDMLVSATTGWTPIATSQQSKLGGSLQ